jgi:hypothetical protein
MDPVAGRLGELLGVKVAKTDDCVGPDVRRTVDEMQPGDVVLLENTRFHKEERDNDEEFAEQLASIGDVFVNDAFGTAHRAHASTVGVTKHVAQSAAGYLLEKEIRYFEKILKGADRPFVAILGGAKVSDKIEAIFNLMEKVQSFVIGGGMAYTFLRAQGTAIGDSLLEEDKIDIATDILAKAESQSVAVHLPVDHVTAQELDARAETRTTDGKEVLEPPTGRKCPTGGRRSTSDRKRWASSGGRSKVPRRSCGTALSGCSRSNRSPRVPRSSRPTWPSLMVRPWCAAATPCPPSLTLAWLERCRTYRPAAGRRSRCSKAESCRG